MMRNKRGLIILIILSLLVFGTALLYSAKAFAQKGINLGNIIPLAIPLILIIFMAFFIVRRWKDADQGVPLEDERSRRVKINAASTAFYISLYWLLAIGMFADDIAKATGEQKIDASQATAAGVGGMAIIFVLCWVYYEKRGKLN